MDTELASTSKNASLPLFPAYSTDVQKQEEKRDWLYNSSFTESALKEVTFQASQQNAETALEEIPPPTAKNVPTESSKRKKKLPKIKYKKYADPSAFSVPESESILCQLRKNTFIEETGLPFERAFRTDAARDHENLMYESFERTKIARYATCFKIPVGLSSKELSRWSQDFPKRKEKAPPRYFNKSFLKTIKLSANENMCTSSNKPLQNSGLDYIPLSATSVQPKEVKSFPSFFNISSSWKSGSKTETVTEDKDTEPLDNEQKAKIIYYNKTLSEDPNNVEMWMDFVKFQDEIFLSEKTDTSLYTNKSLIEKKISILEKALQHNPKDVTLNVLKLKLSQNLYDPDKLALMWEELIFFNPNRPEVWQEYLLHSVSNLTMFHTSHILKIYSKCLRTLSNICEGVTESHKPCPNTVSNMLEMFKQLNTILRSCGYTEKAVALYQALIEFNLFCDSSIERLPVSEKIACFEPFWDSGVPRIGENDAIGWAATLKEKKTSFNYLSTDSDLHHMEDEILSRKLPVAKTWLELERLRGTHHWLPWRPNPEYDQTGDDVEDVDRTVPFEDVSKFLFRVQDEVHQFLLVVHFVTFLGYDLHSLGCHGSGSPDIIHNPYNLEDYENILNQLRENQLIHTSTDSFPIDTYLNEDKCNFIGNVFSQVVNSFSPKYRTLCTFMHVKFQQRLSLKSRNKNDIVVLKKNITGILKRKENRNCLLLWGEYIRIEYLIDKLNAKKSFEALLTSGTSAISSGSMQLQELWYFTQSFIELSVFDEADPSSKILSANEVMWILIHIANKEKYVPYSDQELKPTVILRTVSRLKNILEQELCALDLMQDTLCYCFDPCAYSIVNCVKCFAFFQYFSQGCEAAMEVYEYVISSVNSKVVGHLGRFISEQINVFQAKILNYHTWTSTISIKPLQTFLFSSVKKYPHNSQLLYLLVKMRSASSAISPTRRFLTQILRKCHRSHPGTWFFALIAEFVVCTSLLLQNEPEEKLMTLREISNLGIKWKIRSLYETMLQTDECAHISLLWRSYLKFEIMTQNTEKAKSVYHRALQNCGWSKELLLDVTEYFPDQLEEILAFMNEKQIRIHSPMEEVTLLLDYTSTSS